MPDVHVRLPAGIRVARGAGDLTVEAATVREALERVAERHPDLRRRVFDERGGFAIAVFVNGVSAKRLGGMQAPLANGDTLTLLPPIAGG